MAITTLANVKAVLGITDSSKDSQISAMIPLVEARYLALRNKAFDVVNSVTVYPTGAELTAIKMISYDLKNNNNYGITSESLGDYSVSYEEVLSGYPKSIISEIKKYISFGD